jgi:hypothetical protein
MSKKIGLLALLFVLVSVPAWSQMDVWEEDGEEEERDLKEGWNTFFSFGFDVGQLFQLNPKQGAGQNRFGFGGGFFFDGIYKKDRLLWENAASWQFGVQKLGAGVIVLPGLNREEDVPFQKTIDELRAGSKLGYALSPDSKWYVSGAFSLLTLAAPSYPGTETYPGNFIRNFADTRINTKFFNPATITLSAGLEYVPNDNFRIYFSPLGAKWIVVTDDVIAAQGIHGNPVDRESFNEETRFYEDFDNVDSQLGALLRAAYRKDFIQDRMFYRTNLVLYSNYLRNPQNIDVDWTNELGVKILGGLEISLLVNVFYDDDMLMQISDFDGPNGIKVDEEGNPVLGKRVNLVQQLLIKYSVEF